jgi:hypothetical protein
LGGCDTTVNRAGQWDGVNGVRLWIEDAGGGAGGTAELWGIVIPAHSFVGRANQLMTPLGGYATVGVNGMAGDSVYGTIVKQSTTDDEFFDIAEALSEMPTGIVWSVGVPPGAEMLVVQAGDADVLIEDATAAPLGEIIMTNALAGADGRGVSGAPPAGFRHFSEIGHTLVAQIAGADVLVRIHTHWN